MRFSQLIAIVTFILCLPFSSFAAEMTIGGYVLISTKRVSLSEFDYTYKAEVYNSGGQETNVSATLSTTSQFITIKQGTLTFGTVSTGSKLSDNTFIVRHNRIGAFKTSDLVWNMKYDMTSVTLDGPTNAITIQEGAINNIPFVVNFVTNNSKSFNVELQQTISPDSNGIALSTDYAPKWYLNESKSIVINEKIKGLTAGSYTIVSKSTIVETGQTSQVSTLIKVVKTQETYRVLGLTTSPDAIPIKTATPIKFTVKIDADTVTLLPSVVLEQVNDNGDVIAIIGNLLDDGISDDLVAGDKVFSGVFPIQSDSESRLLFRVSSSTVFSETVKLSVTRFPVEIQPTNMTKLMTDPESGQKYAADEILVSFVEGTSPDIIESTISDAGGSIVGSILGLGYYQVKFNSEIDIEAVISHLTGKQIIDSVQKVSISKLSEVIPNDPRYSDQWGLGSIRADEAWVLARGNVIVAVVDSGVDYNHPDLSGKVIKGKNYALDLSLTGGVLPDFWQWLTNDPMDDLGHGTHVSGIIAANSNNELGIAGISWGSKILAVKVCANTVELFGDDQFIKTGYGCSDSGIAKGIKYSVDNGAKIINLSLGGYIDNDVTKKAIAYAEEKGVLIVAAAGNDNCSNPHYPSAYTSVLAVGATDQNDNRSIWNAGKPECTSNSGSNFGSWVDIAAPGSSILSTILHNGYGRLDGTSMATPFVSGAAALVWSANPTWNAKQVRDRLEKTAKPLPGTNLGSGRLDVFEAIFDGSFELGDLGDWVKSGTASSLTSLGPIVPVNRNGHNNRFGYISTGPAADYISSSLKQKLNIQAGVKSLPIKFDYNFVTEEFPEFVGSIFDDSVHIKLKTPNGSIIDLASESVNTSSFVSVPGIDFPGGDNTVGMTGWKSVSANVPVTEGKGEYEIFIEDAGDDVYDSVILIDNIRFK